MRMKLIYLQYMKKNDPFLTMAVTLCIYQTMLATKTKLQKHTFIRIFNLKSGKISSSRH